MDDNNSTSLQDAFNIPQNETKQEPVTTVPSLDSPVNETLVVPQSVQSNQTIVSTPPTTFQSPVPQVVSPTIPTPISPDVASVPQPSITSTFSPIVPSSTPLAYTAPTPVAQYPTQTPALLTSAPVVLPPQATQFAAAPPPSTPYNFSSPSFALSQKPPVTAPAPYSVPQPNYQPILTPAFSPVAPPPATIVQTNIQPPSQTQLSDVQNANFISSYFENSNSGGKTNESFSQVISGMENNFKA